MVGAALPFLANTLGGGILMGIGYTSGAYTGYGISNTADPLNIHHKSFKNSQFQEISLGMSYGGYGRRRYSRYSRYTRYRRRPYYRRRRYY